MRAADRIIRPWIWLLIGSLLTVFLIPLATHSSWAGQQSIALAPGDQLTVTCPTGMGGAAPGTQAQLTCAAPPPTAVPTAAAGPSITGFSGVQEGQTLGGKIAIVAQVAGDKIAKVVFQLDGPKPATYTEKTAPYTFMGDAKGVPNGWDSTQYPDGDYMLSATVTDTRGQGSAAMVHFHIRNGSQSLPTT
ncbi:MAG: Ig-like domain-containing protein, partial [Roseiflexaceae bacterium]